MRRKPSRESLGERLSRATGIPQAGRARKRSAGKRSRAQRTGGVSVDPKDRDGFTQIHAGSRRRSHRAWRSCKEKIAHLHLCALNRVTKVQQTAKLEP